MSVKPRLGFSINPVFASMASVEAGVKVSCDLKNIFIATLGFGYEDQMWKNGIDLSLNLRAFQLDLGIAMHSQSFLKSWQAAGVGVNVGLKFGW